MRFDPVQLDRGRVHWVSSRVSDGTKFQLPCDIDWWKVCGMPPDQARVAGLIHRREAIRRRSKIRPWRPGQNPKTDRYAFGNTMGAIVWRLF